MTPFGPAKEDAPFPPVSNRGIAHLNAVTPMPELRTTKDVFAMSVIHHSPIAPLLLALGMMQGT